MMVPIRCGEGRSGIGSGVSGRMLSMDESPCAPTSGACPWSRVGIDTFKLIEGFFVWFSSLAWNRNRRAPSGRRRRLTRCGRSGVAQPVGGALPLLDVVGDHPRRLHRGLAQLRIAGNLALHALAFGVKHLAQ